jgi:LPXTG-motif cell wall-anchored protein
MTGEEDSYLAKGAGLLSLLTSLIGGVFLRKKKKQEQVEDNDNDKSR